MKSLLIFLLGGVIGAFAYSLYIARQTTPPTPAVGTPAPGAPASAPSASAPAPSPDTRTLGERAAETTAEIKDSLAAKAKAWRLTPEDIKRELAEGGQIVREKAGSAGGKIADARIVAVIKSKYVLDRDLSAMDIKVECANGHVTLTGSLASIDLVSKAFYHALDTEGVVNVTANLTTPL
jgi:hypothetical protein